MDHEQIMGKIAALLSELIDRDDVELTEATTASDVEDWDSLVQVRLMIGIEAAFKIRFDPKEITAPDNVGELVSLIETKLARA